MTSPLKAIENAERLFAERGAVYGKNWTKVGGALEAFFPDGLKLESAEEFSRFHLFCLCMTKLSRYANQMTEGGHADSADDLVTYAAILRSETDDQQGIPF